MFEADIYCINVICINYIIEYVRLENDTYYIGLYPEIWIDIVFDGYTNGFYPFKTQYNDGHGKMEFLY